MKTIEGHDVKIFTDNIEENAVEQIRTLLSVDVFRGSRIRIMPDVHAGAGCVIGFTGDLGSRVIPNIVGVDIGCGMRVQVLAPGKVYIDYHALNEFIFKNIPSGRNVRDGNYPPLWGGNMEMYSQAKGLVKGLRCYRELKDAKRLSKAAGSLGGGNHFIELDRDGQGGLYLVVHTGSRNLGKQVAEIYQKQAVKNRSGWDKLMERQTVMIEEYKAAGRRNELQEAIRQLHNSFKMSSPDIPAELCYLEGPSREDYLHDMRLCQEWAVLNRTIISNLLTDYLVQNGMAVKGEEPFESVHNYIDDRNMVRKGAISAEAGERCIIPLNMRDGSLICIGKGNPDWNCSAPHGAGRIMSRAQASKLLSMDEFRRSMDGIYSETVSEQTIDEAPMVYKPKDEIIANIADTVSVSAIITPLFNFKAAE